MHFLFLYVCAFPRLQYSVIVLFHSFHSGIHSSINSSILSLSCFTVFTVVFTAVFTAVFCQGVTSKSFINGKYPLIHCVGQFTENHLCTLHIAFKDLTQRVISKV